MIISFDFDGTLAEYRMQQLAIKFYKAGIEVWVITIRKEGAHNKDMEAILNKCRIPIQRVIFTNKQEKSKFVQAINADLHIDNDKSQCDEINNCTSFCSLYYS